MLLRSLYIVIDWINSRIAVAMYLLEIKAACIVNVYLPYLLFARLENFPRAKRKLASHVNEKGSLESEESSYTKTSNQKTLYGRSSFYTFIILPPGFQCFGRRFGKS